MSINILETWDLHHCYLHPIPYSPGPESLLLPSLTLPRGAVCFLPSSDPPTLQLSACLGFLPTRHESATRPPVLVEHLLCPVCARWASGKPHTVGALPQPCKAGPGSPSSLVSQPLLEGDALGQLSGGANFLNSKMDVFFFTFPKRIGSYARCSSLVWCFVCSFLGDPSFSPLPKNII